MKNIGIFGASMLEWGGGVDLLKNIINALSFGEEYKLFLLIPVPGDDLKSKAKIFIKEKVLHKNAFHGIDPSIVEQFKKEYPYVTFAEFVNSNEGLLKKLRENRISILFPCAYSLGRSFPVPWVAYLPDFQHKYLPEFFTKEEIETRDNTFRKRIADSNAFIVTSETAKKDIETFFPECDKKVYVIPFSPSPREAWLAEEKNVLEKFGLLETCRFFLISNQFWIHKDHPCAFKALAKLHENPDFSDVHILCTGEVKDYRNPNYRQELDDLNAGLGVKDYVHFLGYISKEDQMELMKKAAAVVQPTLYEGSPGGGEIEDAVAIGQRSIVSDIPVNREIREDTVTFFEAGSAGSLKEKMEETLRSEYRRPDNDTLRKNGLRRQKHYFEVLKTMIDEMG